MLTAWHGENVITKICFAEGDCSIDIILWWAQFLGFTVGPQINITVFQNICLLK